MSAAPLRCDCCGTSEGVAVFHIPREDGVPFAEALCPTCLQYVALTYAAEWDLYAVLWPAVRAWAARWSRAGLSAATLEGSLELLGLYWHPWHPHGALARPAGAADAVKAALEGEA